MTLQFEIVEGDGTFLFPDIHDEVTQKLDDLLDLRGSGEISETVYIKRLEALLAAVPDFIDGHAHLGYSFLYQGKTKKALAACRAGVAAAEAVIPEGFKGHIEWGFLENRPYLRALHGVALCYLKLKQRQNAIPVLEKMLAWNPGDNQGVRFLIGSEYLRTGKVEKARAIFEAEAASYPPYHYELGLLHLERGEWVKAATSLRRGFATNPYIAEALLGNPAPDALPVWHGSNYGEPDIAIDYVSQLGQLWTRMFDYLWFLNWLYHHSAILTERAEIQQYKEDLLWEEDVTRRRELLEHQWQAQEKITDSLSERIIQKRQGRNGRMIYPWQHRPIDLSAYFH